MAKVKERVPDIVYPKTIVVVPMEYDDYSNGKEEKDALNVFLNVSDASFNLEDNGEDVEECWIATYALVNVQRVKRLETVVVQTVPAKELP